MCKKEIGCSTIISKKVSEIKGLNAEEYAPNAIKRCGLYQGANLRKKAGELYDCYVKEQTGHEIVKLPSTSPANAGYSLEQLCEAWKKILV